MAVVIDNYHVQDKLGSGCFGVVHKAISLDNNEHVAIKIPNKLDKYFMKEILVSKYISNINSKYLLKYNGHRLPNENSKGTCVIQEYFNGVDLKIKLKDVGFFPEDTVRYLFKNIMLGIKDLHDNNVIHHDIKLENILSDNENNIKIIDYGFARVSYATFRKYGVATYGTPIYYAPEIFKKQPYNNKIDIWSAGICLFLLLSGDYPFCANTLNILRIKVTKNDIIWSDKISNSAKDLIKHMLEGNSKMRYSADQVLEHPFLNNKKIE